MKWTEEVKKAFETIPPFVRPAAKKGIEAYAPGSRGGRSSPRWLLKDAKLY